MAELNDYTDLITSEHRDKAKFIATVSVILQPIVDQINLLGSMPTLFDLDTAVGSQLDAVGKWVGVSRRVSTPLTGVYFAFDFDGLGFDRGVWKGPFDPDTGIVSLDDEIYRLVLRAKIASNHWDGTPDSAAVILESLAPPGTLVFIEDNFDMSITIGVSGAQPTALYVALLKNGFLSLKPESVRINYRFSSLNDTSLFGFDMTNQYVSGFDVGSWGTDSVLSQNLLDYTFILDVSLLG